MESVTEDLYDNLHDLVQTPFFKYFRVDLYRECPFWQENGFCMNRECGITTVDEVRTSYPGARTTLLTLYHLQSEVPEGWRAAALSKVEMLSHDDVSNRLHRSSLSSPDVDAVT